MILLILFLLLSLAGYGWAVRQRWMVVGFGSLPAAALCYFFTGIGVARALKSGRFFSVPFGGYAVGGSDAALVGSLLAWLIAWIAVFLFVTRRWNP